MNQADIREGSCVEPGGMTFTPTAPPPPAPLEMDPLSCMIRRLAELVALRDGLTSNVGGFAYASQREPNPSAPALDAAIVVVAGVAGRMAAAKVAA